MEDSIEMTQDEIMSLRRELVYECSTFLLTCYWCKKWQKHYQEVLGESREAIEETYKAVLNNEVIEIEFCQFLFNHVDLRQQKSHLAAKQIHDYKHLIAEFGMFILERRGKQPGWEVGRSEDDIKGGPFWDVNDEYYTELHSEKRREFIEGDMEVELEGGLRFDAWNQARAALFYKLLDVEDDPELKPWTTVMRIDGEEKFICGSVRENVMTTLLRHPDYDDTDVDLMYSYPIQGTFHDIATRPGYTRIRVEDGVKMNNTDDDNFILSSRHNLQYLQTFEEKDSRDQKSFTSISGPALASYTGLNQAMKSVDTVFGLYHPDHVWPAVAEEWRHRERSKASGWPTQALIDRAISHGTYVVPVAHKNSDNPDIEWRYSFSKPEINLMLNITPRQRKCYMLTKRLCKLVFSGFRIFCSYFVKTSFFWLLEETSAVYWEMMSMDDLVDYLLDKIIFFLSGRDLFLPNYFIRTANLIGHIPRDHVATVRGKLQSLRLRRDHCLPPYVLKDFCLYLINMDVSPRGDTFSNLSLPQHRVLIFLLYNGDLACSELPEISLLLQKYWRLSQETFCGTSSDSEAISDSETMCHFKRVCHSATICHSELICYSEPICHSEKISDSEPMCDSEPICHSEQNSDSEPISCSDSKAICDSEQNPDSEPISDSNPSICKTMVSRKRKSESELGSMTISKRKFASKLSEMIITDLLEKLRGLGEDKMLEILAKFTLEEINNQLSTLESEINKNRSKLNLLFNVQYGLSSMN